MLPDGSRDSTVPETVTGDPPGVRVWEVTGAGSEVAGSAGSDMPGGSDCGVLDGLTGGAGSEVAGVDGSGVLEGCVVGSTGGVGVDVG